MHQETTVSNGVKPKKSRHLNTHRPKNVLETHGYVVGPVIGSGSYALVKRAYSKRHGYEVAVKIVSKFAAPPDYLKKFLPREIEVVKGLKHSNLILFLQAIETTHRVYIIMELADRGSLLDAIRREQYIEEPRSRQWFRQLLDAVEYCHDQGVVHRDIKCENLLMDSEYNLKLSDFGFARDQMKTKSGGSLLSETFCGSYAYASPEILRGVPYHPQMADIWSMGIVLFAMSFGRLPFDDSNFNHLLKQVQGKINFPREPQVSSSLKSLISKILCPAKSRLKIPAIRKDTWVVEIPKDSTISLGGTEKYPYQVKSLLGWRNKIYKNESGHSQGCSNLNTDTPKNLIDVGLNLSDLDEIPSNNSNEENID